MDIRIGQGVDVHPYSTGRLLILGGVTIPHSHGLVGHSDADALTHAVIDAVLGAAGKSDIGHFFPDTDERWLNADSLEMLKTVIAEVSIEGWSVTNADATLLMEAPKIAPFIPAMKNNLALALRISKNQVGIKATTTEKLGYIGRGEGVFASCVVLLQRE